jgi:hypothetical protein
MTIPKGLAGQGRNVQVKREFLGSELSRVTANPEAGPRRGKSVGAVEILDARSIGAERLKDPVTVRPLNEQGTRQSRELRL